MKYGQLFIISILATIVVAKPIENSGGSISAANCSPGHLKCCDPTVPVNGTVCVGPPFDTGLSCPREAIFCCTESISGNFEILNCIPVATTS
ncbi:hypothetical protein PM082_009554 [Marasmius tenuissimus]|nr:hypothetical protein PM082_009554 [Marasmius tenuissimus]